MHVALHHPDRVSSLLVADIAPVNYPQSNNNVVEALSILDTQTIASRRDADQAISALIADKVTRGFILKNLQRDNDGGFSLKLNVKSIVANYSNSLVDAPSGEPFSGPTLFIKGETSAYIQEKHRPLIAQLFPASEVQVILGAGHWLHAEKPEEFNRLVIEFLSAHQ